jgi:hypothetical protein
LTERDAEALSKRPKPIKGCSACEEEEEKDLELVHILVSSANRIGLESLLMVFVRSFM